MTQSPERLSSQSYSSSLRRRIRLASLLKRVVLATALAVAAIADAADYAPNRVIVKLKPEPSARKAANARSAVRAGIGGAVIKRLDLIGAEVLDVPDQDVRGLVARWENDPRVEFIEPDLHRPRDGRAQRPELRSIVGYGHGPGAPGVGLRHRY